MKFWPIANTCPTHAHMEIAKTAMTMLIQLYYKWRKSVKIQVIGNRLTILNQHTKFHTFRDILLTRVYYVCRKMGITLELQVRRKIYWSRDIFILIPRINFQDPISMQSAFGWFVC